MSPRSHALARLRGSGKIYASADRGAPGRRMRLPALVGGVSGLALLALGTAGGAWSIFQASTPATSQPVSSATIQSALSGTGSSDSLSVGASNLVAGDSVQREAVVDNSGTGQIGAITLSIVGSTTANALTTNTTDGLQASVQTCGGGTWTATSLSDGGYSYSCSGTADTILGPSPVGSFAAGLTLPSSDGSLAPGSSLPMVVTLTLPSSASNAMQGLSASFTYTFVATQAAGVSQ